MHDIRLSKSSIGAEEKQAVMRILDREYLGMGLEVKSFEKEIAEYIGVDSSNVICTNTGTSALHLALACLDIGPGDEVLVPSLTYVASYQAISATGATPVSCDVTADDLFIDVCDAEKRVTNATKAIMPVHYAGNSEGIPAVYALANKYNLAVIEDAAHSFGCRRDCDNVGFLGDIVCFSFDGIKNITSGEGGAVITGRKNIHKKLSDARLLGIEKDADKRFSGKRSWHFDVKRQGFRYHMSDIMAAIGRQQLKKIDMFGKKRRDLAQEYVNAFRNVDSIELLPFDYENVIPHIFVIKIKGGLRDALRQYLSSCGIETGVHYQLNHVLTLYSSTYELPVSNSVIKEIISLPMHVDISKEDRERVIFEVISYLQNNG